ncbi:MAG: transglutaminase family protein [Acidobacteria bacterium]|jgi:transglutaminase-like putative cysteine protease|nr:transglutaminase family protein [Acidobacteriota bacterium]
MRLKIKHASHYSYTSPVSYGLLQLRQAPKSRVGQQVLSWDLHIEGGKIEAEYEDQNANWVQLVSLIEGAKELVISSEGEVEVEDRAGVIGVHRGFAPLWLFRRATALTRPGPLVRKLAKASPDGSGGDIARLHGVAQLVRDAIRYEPGWTDADTKAEDALEAGHGVCQDHAHVFIAAARLLGYPARYAGGYLMMNDRVQQDAGHAWAEVHVERLGWVGFDISNAISPDSRYVRVATGLDYREAAPVSGMRFGAANESLDVSIQVQQQ